MSQQYHRNGRKVRSDKGKPRPLTPHIKAALNYKAQHGGTFKEALQAVARMR